MLPALKVYLLAAVMLMQTMFWLSPFAITVQTEQLAHMTVHVLEVDHHHHHDESLHAFSDSDSTAPHHHVDNGFQPLGLMANAFGVGISARSGAPVQTRFTEPTTVYLGALLRPPSATV